MDDSEIVTDASARAGGDAGKARVFISHSAKEPHAQAVQAALITELQQPVQAERFALLLDRVTLEPGDMWRSRINLWVGGCDAAVILLSREALSSPYVGFEVAILSYRAAMKDPLLLVPVLLDDVRVEDLKEGWLAPAQLFEIQAVRANGRSAQEIAREVVKKLETIRRLGDTPIERRAKRLELGLRAFEEEDLLEVAELLDPQVPIDCWISDRARKLKLRIALQLLSVGLSDATFAILKLREYLRWKKEVDRAWTAEVIHQVSTSWVDARSVERLPLIARGQASASAVGVAADYAKSLEMYVNCARLQDPAVGRWYQVCCNDVVGQDQMEEVVAELVGKVRAMLSVRLGCKPAELRTTLKHLNASVRQPVVVVLPGRAMSEEILQALTNELPQVTFFLYLGTSSAGEKMNGSAMEVLIPGLTAEDESRILESCETFADAVQCRD